MDAIIEPIDFLRKNLIDFDNFHLNFDRKWGCRGNLHPSIGIPNDDPITCKGIQQMLEECSIVLH